MIYSRMIDGRMILEENVGHIEHIGAQRRYVAVQAVILLWKCKMVAWSAIRLSLWGRKERGEIGVS
jgi:hypothetical protein